jgi:hypothetical protein
MRYTYSSLHHLLGLTVAATGEEIYSDPARGIRAILTSDPSTLCAHLDKAIVLLGMLFRAKVGDDPEMDERLAQEVARLREERAKTYKGGAFLYFEAGGDIPAFTPEVQRDCGSFIVALDGVPKTNVEDLHKPLAGRILAGLAVALPGLTRPQKVAAATLFLGADGKPMYGFNLQMGTPS